MEFKGTKGEWVNEFDKFSHISPNGASIIKAGEIGTPVAIVPMPIGGKNTKERNEANAKLIAAAPLLLKEHQMDLEHLLTWRKELINSGLRGSTLFCEYEDMIDAKKKAIQKALK